MPVVFSQAGVLGEEIEKVDGVESLSLKKQDEKEKGLHGNLVDDRLVDDRLESLLHV